MIPVTPETMAAAYQFLVALPPFSKWNMPDADDIRFVVTRSHDTMGTYHRDAKGGHVIEASSKLVGLPWTLVRLMAHEMLHLHLKEVGVDKTERAHGPAFRKLGTLVANTLGFDPHDF